MSAPEKPVVIRLDISDLRREVDNAALNALLEKGWTVLTSVVIADESGNWMSLVMVPPVAKAFVMPDAGAIRAHLAASSIGLVCGIIAAMYFL
jgi:hypothetical protein